MLMLGAYQGARERPKEIRPREASRAAARSVRRGFSRPRRWRFSRLRKRGEILPAVTSGPALVAPRGAARWLAEDGVPAVDRDGGAGNEVGGGACQEHGHAGHVLERAPASGRRATQHVVVELGHLAARAPGQIGVDPPREDRVDLDVVLGPGGRERFGELDDPALARAVGRRKRDAEDRHHGAEVYDL